MYDVELDGGLRHQCSWTGLSNLRTGTGANLRASIAEYPKLAYALPFKSPLVSRSKHAGEYMHACVVPPVWIHRACADVVVVVVRPPASLSTTATCACASGGGASIYIVFAAVPPHQIGGLAMDSAFVSRCVTARRPAVSFPARNKGQVRIRARLKAFNLKREGQGTVMHMHAPAGHRLWPPVVYYYHLLSGSVGVIFTTKFSMLVSHVSICYKSPRKKEKKNLLPVH